jgi:DNA-binding response OmpR family regulator
MRITPLRFMRGPLALSDEEPNVNSHGRRGAGPPLRAAGGQPIKNPAESAAVHSMAYPVLIVDDDPMLRKLLAAHLTTAGYAITEASGGREGLTTLRGSGARIAFVDYDMPELNGVEFCRMVRADRDIPFAHLVILTAHVDRALTIAALDAGANDFMTKPFHRGELLARLRAGERTVSLHDEAAQAALLECERNDLRAAVHSTRQVITAAADRLRTPIASLKFICESQHEPPRPEQWVRFLSQMKEGIERLSATVDDLLETTVVDPVNS